MFSDDPQRQAMMMLAAGLLSPVRNKGGAGFAEAMAQGIRGGLLGYNEGRQSVDRRAEMEMRRQFQQRQLEEMDRAAGDNAFMRQAAGQFFKPGNAPADGMGPAMPPSFDPAGFGAALASRGMVREAAPFLPKPDAPVKPMVVGKSLVNPETGKVVYQEKEETQDFKDYPSGGRIVRVFKDGTSKVLYNAPEKPESGPAAPQGYRWKADGSGLEPIPGGPADAKVGKEAEALAKRQQGALERANFVLGKVGDAIKETGVTTAGPIGAIGRNIPGTGAYNLNKTIDAIRANIGFGELQAMREASPTGGALGQVAVQELAMLQSVLGSLDTAQSPQQLEKTLYAIEKHYRNWQNAVKQAGQEGAGGDAVPPPKPGTVDGDYYFKGGDPADQKNWVKRK